jgi:flagellar basal-body rod modification protein FlgD
MATNSVSPLAASTTGSNSSTSTSTNGLSGDDFMTLLVAELKNQDPTQPLDPTQFMAQLVELNQLEQTIQIREILQQSFGAPSSTSADLTI